MIYAIHLTAEFLFRVIGLLGGLMHVLIDRGKEYCVGQCSYLVHDGGAYCGLYRVKRGQYR